MQLIKVTEQRTGVETLLNRMLIESVRASKFGSSVHYTGEINPVNITESPDDVISNDIYFHGGFISVPIVVPGGAQNIAIPVVKISKVVKSGGGSNSLIYTTDGKRFTALATLDSIQTISNLTPDGGTVPTPGGGSGGEGAAVKNFIATGYTTVIGANTIVHGESGQVFSVAVNQGGSWIPYSWDDVDSNTIQITFAEIVEVDIIVTII